MNKGKGKGRPRVAPSGPEERVCSVLLRRVNRDVRDHFKSICARRGTTMTKALVDMMRAEIRRARA